MSTGFPFMIPNVLSHFGHSFGSWSFFDVGLSSNIIQRKYLEMIERKTKMINRNMIILTSKMQRIIGF